MTIFHVLKYPYEDRYLNEKLIDSYWKRLKTLSNQGILKNFTAGEIWKEVALNYEEPIEINDLE